MFVRCRGGGGDGQNTIDPLHPESPLLPSEFFPIFSVFIFSIPSKSVNDSKTIYVLKHDYVFGPFSESLQHSPDGKG